MGNGNIDVGKPAATREGPSGPRIDKPKSLNVEPRSVCRAMTQQSGSGHGHECAPQKFVHLVGYRDPNARLEPWVRPAKR